MVRVAKGRYALAESIKNYIVDLKVQNDVAGQEKADDLDLEKEKALHENIKRQQAEIKLALMKGEVHKSYDVETVMVDMLTSFRTRILNIPSKVAPMLVARHDAGLIQELIMREIVEVLNELKDYNPEDFYSGEYIDYEEETDGERRKDLSQDT